MSGSWLTQLASSGSSGDGITVSIGADAESVASQLGAQAVRWADAVGCEAAARIIDTVPELGSNAAHLRLVRRAVVSTVLRCVLVFRGAGVGLITDEARETVRDFARRGLPLTGILRAIRIGQASIVEHFLQAVASADAPAATAEMQRVLRILLHEFDAFVTAVEAEFRDEYENGLAATAAARIQTINQVLSGAVDPLKAGSELDYLLTGHHIALVAWSRAEPGSGTDATVRQAASELLTSFGTGRTLLVPVGAGAIWAWGTVADTRWVEMAASRTLPPDVDIAVGDPGEGVDGFRASHTEARAVERLLRLATRPPHHRVTFYQHTALAILMATDLQAARVFLRRTLGGLIEDDNPRTHDIRTTTRLYLDEGRSLTKTAEQLHIARNTVTYRVHRAEELLGRSLTTHHLQVHAALMLSDYIDAEPAD